MYNVIYTGKAERDINFHTKSGNRSLLKKLGVLIDELHRHPYTGTGKPEQLNLMKNILYCSYNSKNTVFKEERFYGRDSGY
ncbi:MAG: type II toxin-antitoxin system YoeB family toxin [Chitinispirillales bacterium]|jgi:Txe/YoeB family toxin of Txe-Axe toxin-antitoxin module|nr:type II toxin-antitoxin system YoeB family toxin [Chitinispirillales bacterium]